MKADYLRGALEVFATFAAAAIGWLVFAAIGFPAAALTGSAAAVSVAALAGLPISIPTWLRNICFVALGVNIGTGVSPEAIDGIATWPVTVAIMGASLLASLALCRLVLERGFGFQPLTAALASMPGHLSFILGVAVDRGANVSVVGLVQSIRVLFLTLALPLIVEHVFGAGDLQVLPTHLMGYPTAGGLIAASLVLSFVFLRLKFLAPFLLGGMILSAAGHLTQVTPGRLPDVLTIVAFLMLGALIGSRFAGESLRSLRSVFWAGFVVTVITVSIAGIGVIVAMLSVGMPPALLIVGFSPGGVEVMAAIAVQFGLDPTFVATHHLVRLAILSMVIPVILARVGR